MDASTLEDVGLVYGLFLFIVVRRTIRLAQGTPYSEARLAFNAILYLFLFGLAIVYDVGLLPSWSFLVDGAVIVAGVAVATRHVARVVVFSRGPSGVQYRLGLALPVLYLVLYVVRVAVDLVLLNENPLAGPTGLPVLTGWQVVALLAVNALFSLSAGLLVGRSIGVYLAYRARGAAATAVPLPPTPPPPLSSYGPGGAVPPPPPPGAP